MTTSLHTLTDKDFKAFLEKPLMIYFQADIPTPAILTSILDLPAHPKIERKPFSILLETQDKQHHYPQATYAVAHPVLGVLHIFLVPVGFGAQGIQYEAIFS